jgi:hypothetical protein
MIDADRITRLATVLIERLNKPVADFLTEQQPKPIDLVENKEAGVEAHMAQAVALCFHTELTLHTMNPTQQGAVRHEANRLLMSFLQTL